MDEADRALSSEIAAGPAAATGRPLMEGELRRALEESSAQPIVLLDAAGNAIKENRTVLEYTGLTMDQVRERSFRSRVFRRDDVERLRVERQQGLARELPFSNEQRALRKDGQYRWFLVQYNPFRDPLGRLLRWYVTGTDVDDRKRADERARADDQALRDEIDCCSMFGEIVGSSAPLKRVLAQVTRVAATDTTVLIVGETGTGKELIAQA